MRKSSALLVGIVVATAFARAALAVPPRSSVPVGCLEGPEIPNRDFGQLGPEDRIAVIQAIEPMPCTCGCSMGLLECAVIDPICPAGRAVGSDRRRIQE